MKQSDCGEKLPSEQTFQLQDSENAGDNLDMVGCQTIDFEYVRSALSAATVHDISQGPSFRVLSVASRYIRRLRRILILWRVDRYLRARAAEREGHWKKYRDFVLTGKYGFVVIPNNELAEIEQTAAYLKRYMITLRGDLDVVVECHPKLARRLLDTIDRLEAVQNGFESTTPSSIMMSRKEPPDEVLDIETLADALQGV